ncbi:MAG: FliO/MopB family protein [Motilibacteraceae bacterium]
MNGAALAARVTLSLIAVLGVMWVAARVLQSRGAGRSAGVVEVVSRAPLGKGSSVAVVKVAGDVLVLGVTEHSVSLLGAADPAAVEAATARPAPVERREPVVELSGAGSGVAAPAAAAATSGPLAGSVLSPGTWRQAVEVLRERSVRKG